MLETVGEAKAQAKLLRSRLLAEGQVISHSEALERVAHLAGARDWNTLHARLAKGQARVELALGDAVRGQYLGQDFTGRIMALAAEGDGRAVEIRFDEAVDVVRFDSFSNLRRQVRGVIDAWGNSAEKTSDGVPQLRVRRVLSDPR
ncbi:glyoxalase superfamily protein [Neogemmobacter tilapiae]|uniref:Glyoxalase-related protein domain-containing protein n=1 Tax=Neogemmobacter tilapiae TaxID=875041 RepID=A0A918TSB8_9RHOB|nr:glyoxalase superfamily protein [Gemmobacter tilapiae]GHC54620.1 hypothetical protein GCM10007315_16960 [Gemmobacter tilapiae]